MFWVKMNTFTSLGGLTGDTDGVWRGRVQIKPGFTVEFLRNQDVLTQKDHIIFHRCFTQHLHILKMSDSKES